MGSRPYRVAYLVTHPIQYQAPLLRHLSAQDDLDLCVFFLSDHSVRSYADPGFGHSVEWDVPLVEGYRHVYLPREVSGQPPGRVTPLCLGLRAQLQHEQRERGPFDAFWLHGYSHQVHLRAIAIARSLGIKVFLRGESLLGPERDSRWLAPLKARVLRSLFRRVDGCLAIGSANAAFYAQHGVPAERIFSMPYAVDNAFFQARSAAAEAQRDTLRRTLDLDPARPVLLYASKFQARKRPLDLLEAYAQLSTDGATPAPYLLYIGDGEERDRVDARRRALGWDSVRMLGFKNQTELPAYYDLCDAFVLPSSYEPWGLVINEVMNAARPVIASDRVGAAHDLIEDGVTGRTYPAGNIEQLSACLRDLTTDRERARTMGLRARARVNAWSFAEDAAGLRAALEASAA